MKTVFKSGAYEGALSYYERVSDEVAEVRVNNQGWKFVSKQEWKQNARPKPTEKQNVEVEKKEVTMSKKAAKRLKIKEKQRQS